MDVRKWLFFVLQSGVPSANHFPNHIVIVNPLHRLDSVTAVPVFERLSIHERHNSPRRFFARKRCYIRGIHRSRMKIKVQNLSQFIQRVGRIARGDLQASHIFQGAFLLQSTNLFNLIPDFCSPFILHLLGSIPHAIFEIADQLLPVSLEKLFKGVDVLTIFRF